MEEAPYMQERVRKNAAKFLNAWRKSKIKKDHKLWAARYKHRVSPYPQSAFAVALAGSEVGGFFQKASVKAFLNLGQDSGEVDIGGAVALRYVEVASGTSTCKVPMTPSGVAHFIYQGIVDVIETIRTVGGSADFDGNGNRSPPGATCRVRDSFSLGDGSLQQCRHAHCVAVLRGDVNWLRRLAPRAAVDGGAAREEELDEP